MGALRAGRRLRAVPCPPPSTPRALTSFSHAPFMAPCARSCALNTARTSGFIGGAWVGPLKVTQRVGGDRRPHPRGRRTGPGGERRLPDRARFRGAPAHRPGLPKARTGTRARRHPSWYGGAWAAGVAQGGARPGRGASGPAGCCTRRASPPPRGAPSSASGRAEQVGPRRPPAGHGSHGEGGTGPRSPHPRAPSARLVRSPPRHFPGHMPLACPPRPVPAPQRNDSPTQLTSPPGVPRLAPPRYPVPPQRAVTPSRPPSAIVRPTRHQLANPSQLRLLLANFTQESAKPAFRPGPHGPQTGLPLAVRNGLVAPAGTSAPGLVTAW